MKNNPRLAVFFPVLAAAGVAIADYKVDMNAIDIKGVGASLGTIKVSAAPKGGVLFTPDLKGLPAGTHGFHVHEFANCGAKEKDGKMEPGEMAGGHYDPKKKPADVKIDRERVDFWVSKGAQLSPTVKSLLKKTPKQ